MLDSGEKFQLGVHEGAERIVDGGFITTTDKQTLIYGEPPILAGLQKFEIHVSKWPACVGVVTQRVGNFVESSSLANLLSGRGGAYFVWCIDGIGRFFFFFFFFEFLPKIQSNFLQQELPFVTRWGLKLRRQEKNF